MNGNRCRWETGRGCCRFMRLGRQAGRVQEKASRSGYMGARGRAWVLWRMKLEWGKVCGLIPMKESARIRDIP